MKISSSKGKSFQPIDLIIRIESKDEFDVLVNLTSYNTEVAQLISDKTLMHCDKKILLSEILGDIWDELYVET